jgi:hypothetical protein
LTQGNQSSSLSNCCSFNFGVFIKKLRETKQKDNGILEGAKSFIRSILKLQEVSDQY